MGKDKLKKWAENANFNHVFEPDLQAAVKGVDGEMKGKWSEIFKNDNPITVVILFIMILAFLF